MDLEITPHFALSVSQFINLFWFLGNSFFPSSLLSLYTTSTFPHSELTLIYFLCSLFGATILLFLLQVNAIKNGTTNWKVQSFGCLVVSSIFILCFIFDLVIIYSGSIPSEMEIDGVISGMIVWLSLAALNYRAWTNSEVLLDQNDFNIFDSTTWSSLRLPESSLKSPLLAFLVLQLSFGLPLLICPETFLTMHIPDTASIINDLILLQSRHIGKVMILNTFLSVLTLSVETIISSDATYKILRSYVLTFLFFLGINSCESLIIHLTSWSYRDLSGISMHLITVIQLVGVTGYGLWKLEGHKVTVWNGKTKNPKSPKKRREMSLD